MIITRRWLENYIDLTGVRDEEITTALNSLGFEVDAYKSYKELNDNLTLGFISNVAQIEGTRLNFCFVDKGEELVSTIVTGATNVYEGQYVIVADPGKKISTGVTLETKELQGKLSEGMIISLPEIGMSTSHLTKLEIDEYIYEVFTKQDAYSLIGNQDALEIIGFKDSTWEVDLTLNRSDALSSLQLVKEIANYFEKKIWDLSLEYEEKKSPNNVDISFVKNKDNKKLIRSLALQQFDIKKIISIDKRVLNIYSSQDIWLKFSGCKTTENFWLDLGNAIAIETGQPVIFLDPSKLTQQLEIKNNKNENNSTNYQLMHGNEVISTIGVNFNHNFLPTVDSEKVLAIYLSLDSSEMRKQQKSFNTSSVFLQRWMKPISSKIYNLASKHTVYWLDQYELYQASSPLEVQIPSEEKRTEITVELDYIHQVMGIELKPKEIKSLFRSLDFEVIEIDKKNLLFKIDEMRTDILNRADIVEEISRLYGYNNINSVAPEIKATVKEKSLSLNLKNQIENYIIGLGFNNVKTYSLMNTKEVKKWDLFNIKDPIKLMSPLSQNREAYRLSLSRSLVEVANLNYVRGNKNLKLYEIADIYNQKNVREKHLGMLVSGDIIVQKAYKIDIKSDFAYLKGILDQILNQYQILQKDLSIVNMNEQHEDIHPYINGEIRVKNRLIGFIYKLNPRFEQANKIDSTFILELNLSAIEEVANFKVRAVEIPRFQKTFRDVTMLLTEEHQFNEVLVKISDNVNYIIQTSLVDIFRDEALKKAKKTAISVSFWFNSDEKQLTDEIISAEWDKILKNLAKLKIEVK